MDKDQQQKHLIDEALRLLESQYAVSKDFNAYFDGDEPLVFASLRPEGGEYRYEKSRVMFWLDHEAYADEKTDWENKAIQERHEEAIKLLRANGQTAPFREIVEAVKRQRIVPFVGAGLSKPMDMALWGEALAKLRGKLPSMNDPNFETLCAQGCYPEAAQILADHDALFTNNFIRTAFSIQKIAGPVTLMPKVSVGCIVTTNFDSAIEEVFKINNNPFDGYMHGTQHHNFFARLVKGERCILKLHGDAAESQTYIFTRNHYTAAYGEPFDFSKPLPKALRQIFIANSLLFLGCSLEQDWTLELFKAVKDKGEYEIPNHYAILQEPDTPAARQLKESRLLGHNIQPIWYPAEQHEYVEKLMCLVIDVAEKRMAFHG